MPEAASSGGSLDDPVLNGPHHLPSRHFEIGPKGPTGSIVEGRCPSESFIPVAPVRKCGKGATGVQAEQLALTLPYEQVQRNSLMNGLRQEVALWRARRYEGVTPTSGKLVEHWADETRENRILFAQREAAETAIFLAEVSAPRRLLPLVRPAR